MVHWIKTTVHILAILWLDPSQWSQPSRAPRAFMSSKKAVYESSMLCAFGADDELTGSGFTIVGAGVLETIVEVDTAGFGFVLVIEVSLLTRTDAGT